VSEIPLHLQRKFEQRWASKFVLPTAAAGPKSTDLKGIINSLQRPSITQETHDGRMIPKPAK
jgi:hypothetical protein